MDEGDNERKKGGGEERTGVRGEEGKVGKRESREEEKRGRSALAEEEREGIKEGAVTEGMDGSRSSAEI